MNMQEKMVRQKIIMKDELAIHGYPEENAESVLSFS